MLINKWNFSSGGGGGGQYGTVGRSSGGGMASMMDEMQKTLARRRAKVDRSSEEPDSDSKENGDVRRDMLEKSASPGKPLSQPGSQAGSESPKPGRRRHSTRGSICGQDVDLMSTSFSAAHGAGGHGPGRCTGPLVTTPPSKPFKKSDRHYSFDGIDTDEIK